MGTIYFKENLVHMAEKIIELKKAEGDKKAAEDLAELLNAIANINQCNEIYIQSLDRRLREDYHTIEILEQIPTPFGSQTANPGPRMPENERRLGVDYFGICLDALLKEKIIATAEEYIKN